jgi:cytochrome c oxidase subunit IV
MTTPHDFGGCVGTAFGHFLFDPHNFMVTALGSCLKWPLVMICDLVKTGTMMYMSWEKLVVGK